MSRGQGCGDIEFASYLSTTVGPVSMVMDLRIAHELWTSTSNPSLDDHLHYPDDIDRTLNETAADKVLQSVYKKIRKLTDFLQLQEFS